MLSTIFTRTSILNACLGYEYASGIPEAVARRCSVGKGVLRYFAKFTGKLCNKVAGLKKKTLAQMFSCEFCEISKNTFFYRTPPVAASGIR